MWSFVAKTNHRIDPRRGARRNLIRRERNRSEQTDYAGKGQRIARRDSVKQAGQNPGKRESRHDSDRNPKPGELHFAPMTSRSPAPNDSAVGLIQIYDVSTANR